MRSTTHQRRTRRRILAATTAVALGAGGLLVGAVPAGSAPDAQAAGDAYDGTLDWGLKASFRNYIEGPIAHGQIEVGEPATRNVDGTFRFAEASGTADLEAGTADLQFAGNVYLSGHDSGDGPQLELTLTDPSVHIEGDAGTLVADVVSKSLESGELVEYPGVELGAVDLTAHPLTGDDETVSVTGAPVTLTEQGVPAFADFYPAGTELDPLSFTVELDPAGQAPSITAQPSDVTVDAGRDATFAAAATGDPEPSVRWESRAAAGEWSALDGAGEPTLTLTDVTADQDGSQYRAVFSNGVEPEAVTDPATLTVTAADPGWEPAVEVFAADGETPIGDAEPTYGDTVVVRGSGFDPEGNVAPDGNRPPIPAGVPAGSYVVFGKFADDWRPSAGAPSSARVVGAQQWALAEAALERVPEQFQQTIREQWTPIEGDGTFTAELTIAQPVDRETGEPVPWPEEGALGVYTYAAGGTVNADQELSVALDVAEDEPAGPTVTVTPTENLDPYAEQITVTGAGFPAADLPGGLRVGIGTATGDDTVPALDPVQTVEVDGAFEVTLDTADVEPGAELVVYTVPVDDGADVAYATRTPITYAAERTPELTVTPTENLEVGTVVEVEGTGFAPERRISIAFSPNTEQHPDYGWPTGWLHHGVVRADAAGEFTHTITIADTVTGAGTDCAETACVLASFSSAQASDAEPVDYRADRSQDVFVPVTFAAADPDPDPDPEPVDPSVQVDPSTVAPGDALRITGAALPPGTDVTAVIDRDAAPASDGALDWGVKETFRSYIQGSIAHGDIDVRAPATENADGTVRFGEGSGSGDADSVTAAFGGEVYFWGHDSGSGPLLELTLTEPRVNIDGTDGVLVADVASRSLDSGEAVTYDDVELAVLDFAAAPVTVTGGVASATGVPAVLTEQGAPAFADFYPAGTALDPVTFSVPVAETAATDVGTATVGTDGALELTWTVPEEFPAGEHTVDLVADSASLAATGFTVTDGADPDSTSDPDPTPDPTSDPTTGPSGDSGSDAGVGTAGLPDTGVPGWLFTVAFVLLGAGVTAVAVRRRFV